MLIPSVLESLLGWRTIGNDLELLIAVIVVESVDRVGRFRRKMVGFCVDVGFGMGVGVKWGSIGSWVKFVYASLLFGGRWSVVYFVCYELVVGR